MNVITPDGAAAARLPTSTYFLAFGQSINLTAAVLSVTIAALTGSALAPSPVWGTVPYGAQFAAVMLCTYPASMMMRIVGRRKGFCIGAIFLMLAGIVGYWAMQASSFEALLLSHFLLGVYVSFANYYRFAAVDDLTPSLRPKGMSLVVAGGVLAALAGPSLATELQAVEGYAGFALCYAALTVLGLLTLLLMIFWKPAMPTSHAAADTIVLPLARQPVPICWTWPIFAAVFSSAVGYMLMNLLMVQGELTMKDLCVSFASSSQAIQAHVLAMFAPSLITGIIINRIGLRSTLIAGFVLLICSMLVGVLFFHYNFIFFGLVLLGLGWNLTYVGGGALLAKSVPDDARHRWQGINDSLIAICATIGALLPAVLQSTMGWQGSNFISLILCLCGIPVCWKALSSMTTRNKTGIANAAE